jgi:hypothetical protein
MRINVAMLIGFLYGDVDGMWLQTASEATATVRILGQHTVVSQNVKYDIDELVAAGPQQASQAEFPRGVSTQHHPGSSK